MPSPSPTTTSAVKLNRRPPLTTLATRLIATTRSTYAVLSAPWAPRRSSRPPRRSPPARCPRWGPLMTGSSSLRFSSSSEPQAALAGAVGNGCDPTVVLVAGPVEDHAFDTGCLRALGHQLAHQAGLGGLVALLGAEVGLHRRGGRDGLAHLVVDDLDGDVPRRPRHDQAWPVGGAGDLLSATRLSAAPGMRG